MSPDEIEDEMRRTLIAKLGQQRVAELESEIVDTARQLAIVLNEPVKLDDEDPDFMRPLV
jgi:hypothetical protein